MLKWRCVLPLMTSLAPPGYPMADRKKISSIFMKEYSSRSYQPAWSIHCRTISSGGIANYSSFLGIFRSSTKMHIFFMPSGPKTPNFLRASFCCIISWVEFTSVCALKEIVMFEKIFMSKLCIRLWLFMDLPVPVGPTNKTCFMLVNNNLVTFMYMIESSVGTAISS